MDQSIFILAITGSSNTPINYFSFFLIEIEIYSDQGTPLLFISTCACSCFRIRKDLNLEEYKYRGLNFDLNSTNDTMKKIVILPEMLPPETYQLLKSFYGKILTELDNKKANELLVKSTPTEKSLKAVESLQVCAKMH